MWRTGLKQAGPPRLKTMNDHQYPKIFLKLLEALQLPQDIQGIQKLHKIMKVEKVMKTLITKKECESLGLDSWSVGCLNSERIHNEIFPEIAKKYPELPKFLERPELKDRIRFDHLANWLHYLIEDLALLSGNRPLPFSITPVKNIFYLGSNSPPGPEFGFLTWNNPGCTIKVTAENGDGYGKHKTIREIEYPTTLDALMSGWKVD